MDYGRVIGDAWTMTWRYRFLWILGLFAPTGFGGCSANFNLPSNFTSPATPRATPTPSGPPTSGFGTPGMEQIQTAVGTWVGTHLGLIFGIVAAVVLLALVFLVVYFVAQGGMASATIRLARGEPESLGPAWRAGRHFFWRYVGLWLLEVVIFVVAAALAGGLVVAGVALIRQNAGGGAVAIGILLGLLGVVLVLALIAAAILFSIVVAYSQRIIVAEDVGPWTAITRGVALIRAHLGTSLLLWLINLGLGIGVGIAVALADVIVLIPLGIVGLIFALVFHFTAITIAYIVVAAVVFLAAAWLFSAIANTFFWNYWTLAYLKLEETGT